MRAATKVTKRELRRGDAGVRASGGGAAPGRGEADSFRLRQRREDEQRRRPRGRQLGATHHAQGCSSERPDRSGWIHRANCQVEKDKQDNALSDLSDVLGQLKGMALDMGSEIDRQNKVMDGLQDDVEELNSRVKGANQRARRLLGKYILP